MNKVTCKQLAVEKIFGAKLISSTFESSTDSGGKILYHSFAAKIETKSMFMVWFYISIKIPSK